MSKLLTAKELATHFGVSVDTVRRVWVKGGKCPYLIRREGIKKVKVFDPDAVQRWYDVWIEVQNAKKGRKKKVIESV